MGGNAIKKFGYEGKRLSRVDYWKLVAKVRRELGDVLPRQTRFDVIPSYWTKETFGDLDMLIENVKYYNFPEMIMEVFGATQIYSNNNTHSFAINGFQVDFIVVDRSIFTPAYHYFSWNDCGNLCGCVFHGFGLKYGHEGLQYVVRERTVGLSDNLNSAVLATVSLSKNCHDILKFGGFDHKQFDKGFNTLEDMFHWVASSKYFNADQYNLDKLNHINRTRNRKRSSYTKFLKWLETNKHKYGKYEYNEDSLVYLPKVEAAFPELTQALKDAKEACEDRRFQSSKFNGHLIKEWVDTSTSVDSSKTQIGQWLFGFKYEVEEVFEVKFDQWVRSQNHDQVKLAFVNWYRGNPLK